MNSIPVIDIAALVKGSPEEARAAAKALGDACRDVGFFYVSGHGVPSDLIARVFAMSAGFFAAPAAIRKDWNCSTGARRCGWCFRSGSIRRGRYGRC